MDISRNPFVIKPLCDFVLLFSTAEHYQAFQTKVCHLRNDNNDHDSTSSHSLCSSTFSSEDSTTPLSAPAMPSFTRLVGRILLFDKPHRTTLFAGKKEVACLLWALGQAPIAKCEYEA
jgi:hypothetical protein